MSMGQKTHNEIYSLQMVYKLGITHSPKYFTMGMSGLVRKEEG
jgi:hypothetical protein